MLHRVRHSLGLNNQPTGKLEGTCEADETYIGGQEKNKHQSKKTKGTQGRSLKTKIPVVGIIKRGGELRANVVDGTSGEILKKFIHENLEVGNPLNTDEWLCQKLFLEIN